MTRHGTHKLVRSWLLAMALACAMAPIGPAHPTRADDPVREDDRPDRNPAIARLQVVLKYVQVDDDADWFGKGEFVLDLTMDRFLGDCDAPELCAGPMRGSARQRMAFSASTGSFYQFDRVLPDGNIDDHGLVDSPEFGVELHQNEVLRLNFYASEQDPDIPIGSDFRPGHYPTGPVLREEQGWGTGSHRVRLQDDFDITVFYEVRQTPLPDLVPHHVTPRKLDDGRDIACASALNKGQEPSDPFTLVLTVDGTEPAGGRFTMWGLKPAEVGDHCFLTGPLAAGTHEFGLTVDPERAIAEMDESNNQIQEMFSVQPAQQANQLSSAVAPQSRGPDAVASTARADLEILSIRVKGKDPSGQNDCDPGKNDVTLVVKNDGVAGAATFAVRLLVDDDDDLERTVSSLDAGKQTNVEFEGVQLKEGERKLTGSVDVQKRIAESSEDNNELKVSVRCRDER